MHEELPTETDDYLRDLRAGVFVAVNISNYKKFPVIGKVIHVHEKKFEIEYWQGSYNKPWYPHLITRNKKKVAWSDTLPKQSIILCNFLLDDNGKLQENTRKFLKRWRKDADK